MLRLVTSDGGADASEGASSDANSPPTVWREIESEAEAIEAWYGKNPYSDFLLAHKSRPDPARAADLGRFMGGQVKAADGSMQPPLNRHRRSQVANIRDRRRRRSEKLEKTCKLREALATLAENRRDGTGPVDLVRTFLDERVILEQIDDAVHWLRRFALEWGDHEKNEGPCNSQSLERDSG